MPRNEPFEMWVTASPEDVRERFRGKVEFRLFPEFGRQFGLTLRPLGGQVSTEKMNVALNRPRWIASLNPRVKATLTPEAGGTRISGEIGMSTSMLNYLRFSFVFGILMMLFGVGGAIASGPGGLVAAAGIFGFVMTVLVFSLGFSVNLADADVDELNDLVRSVVDNNPVTEADRAAVAAPIDDTLPREVVGEASPAMRTPRKEEA